MVVVYKNLLIVDREDRIQHARDLVNRLGADFNDSKRIWHIKSPRDNVVLIYKDPIINDNEIHTFNTVEEAKFSLNEFVGYIQVYSQGKNIKISKFMINKSLAEQQQYWAIYKQYLIQTIRKTGLTNDQLAQTAFTIYWDKFGRDIQEYMARIGLLSDFAHNTYVFKFEEIQHPINWPNMGSWRLF